MYMVLSPVPSEVNIYTATDFHKYRIKYSTVLKAFHIRLDISHYKLLKKIYNFTFLYGYFWYWAQCPFI